MDRRRSLTTTENELPVSVNSSVSCEDAENEDYGCNEVETIDCSLQTEDYIALNKDIQTDTKCQQHKLVPLRLCLLLHFFSVYQLRPTQYQWQLQVLIRVLP